MSRFDDEPTPSLQLTSELLGGHSPKQRLGVRHVCSQFDRWSASFVEGRLQPGNQLLGLVAGELAGGLALRETHRSTGIPEVLVARSPEKRQQFAHLT